MIQKPTRSFWVLISSYVALGMLLISTDPRRLPIILLILPFVLLFTALYLTVRLLVKRFLPRVGRRKRIFISTCVGGVPSFLLLLSSVNQLTWRDVALVSFLVICLLFYSSRANFARR